MSSPETSDTTLQECVVAPEEKKNKWRGTSIAAMVVGLLLVCAGLFSWFEDESLNNSMIQAGAAQAVHAAVLEEPEAAKYALTAAELIEKAIDARIGSPEELANLLCSSSEAFQGPGVKQVLVAIIHQINAAHTASSTEDIYLTKLLYLAKGIRDGVCVE